MSNEAVQEPPAQPSEPQQSETAIANRTGAMEFGVVPRNFDEAWRMASVLARSKMVPKGYQGEAEDVLVAMMYGAEIGLPTMASLQSVAVINGKPGVYGDGFLGVIQATPAYHRHQEYYELADGTKVRSLRQADYSQDDTKAVSLFWRKGNQEPFVGEFSIGDAKRAKLWGKEGPWSTYPGRQLLWRARGYAGRNGFAAELRGIKTAEELLDTPDDLIVETVPTGPPVPLTRRSEKVADGAEVSAEPAAPQAAAETTREPTTPAKTEPAKAPTRQSTRKPESKAQTGAGPTVLTEGMLITDSAYVQPKDQEPFWEVKATVQKNGEPAVDMTFVTRDEALYKIASSCEGTNAKFNIRWHGGKRPDGTACKVLEAIEAAN